MQKKYKIMLSVIAFLIILVAIIGSLKMFISKKENPKNATNIISNINEFGYTLDDRDSEYMKSLFNELKDELLKEEIDYDNYATLLSKLFITDFYTLENKINKYDVGGLEYILNSSTDSFKQKAMDTIYKQVIDNTDKKRVQDLPIITDVTIKDLTEEKVELNEEEINTTKVIFEATYKKDLGYDNEGTIYLVKNNKKLEIIKYSPEI